MTGRVLALSGGIGGAKLALGLRRVLPPGALTVIANTGDDFDHLGLRICPDIDTLLYTLGGLADPVRGWGRCRETWSFMAALRALGGPAWFNLGDADLATHVLRTARLAEGATLSEVTALLARQMAVGAAILPMSDDPVRTRLLTSEGWLDFQHYFVERRCEPVVREIAFVGAERATTPPGLAPLLAGGLDAVVICPSNPFISIEPILAVPGLRAALRNCGAPVVAVSPIIGGEAVKGPTAKMFRELGLGASAAAVAGRYRGLIDAFIVDHADAGLVVPGVEVVAAPTLMTSLADRERLAARVLEVAGRGQWPDPDAHDPSGR
jgi:LPPG:FO 2-phospho-L-lactate transferase